MFEENHEQDVALDLAARILDLIESGVSVDVVGMAVSRAADDDSFGALLGLLEDLLEVDGLKV